jgi:hypothetical protein
VHSEENKAGDSSLENANSLVQLNDEAKPPWSVGASNETASVSPLLEKIACDKAGGGMA